MTKSKIKYGRGIFLGPPLATKQAAVIAGKNIKVSYFEISENTQRQSLGHIAQFRIMNLYQ